MFHVLQFFILVGCEPLWRTSNGEIGYRLCESNRTNELTTAIFAHIILHTEQFFAIFFYLCTLAMGTMKFYCYFPETKNL